MVKDNQEVARGLGYVVTRLSPGEDIFPLSERVVERLAQSIRDTFLVQGIHPRSVDVGVYSRDQNYTKLRVTID